MDCLLDSHRPRVRYSAPVFVWLTMADISRQKRPRLVKLGNMQRGQSCRSSGQTALQLTHTRVFTEPQHLHEPCLQASPRLAPARAIWAAAAEKPSVMVPAISLKPAALLGDHRTQAFLAAMQNSLLPKLVAANSVHPQQSRLSFMTALPGPKPLVSPVLTAEHKVLSA